MTVIRKAGRPPRIEKMEDEVVVVKKGTRPGWRPSSVLPNLKAKSGFTARWVRNEPANVARKRTEGWLLMRPHDNIGIEIGSDTPDSNSVASEIRYQDMIAMMLPDDVKQDREEYHRNEIRHATKSILRQSDEEFKSMGVQTYAPKGQKGRIVID